METNMQSCRGKECRFHTTCFDVIQVYIWHVTAFLCCITSLYPNAHTKYVKIRYMPNSQRRLLGRRRSFCMYRVWYKVPHHVVRCVDMAHQKYIVYVEGARHRETRCTMSVCVWGWALLLFGIWLIIAETSPHSRRSSLSANATVATPPPVAKRPSTCIQPREIVFQNT